MNDSELKKLYNALISKGYSADDLGDESVFSQQMSDPKNRKELYDYVVGRNDFNIGDYDTYESRLTSGGGTAAVPQSTPSEEGDEDYTFTETEDGGLAPVRSADYTARAQTAGQRAIERARGGTLMRGMVSERPKDNPLRGGAGPREQNSRTQSVAKAPQTGKRNAVLPAGFGELDLAQGRDLSNGVAAREGGNAIIEQVGRASRGDEQAARDAGLDRVSAQMRDQLDYTNATGRMLRNPAGVDQTQIGIAPTIARDENGNVITGENGEPLVGAVSDEVRANTQNEMEQRVDAAAEERAARAAELGNARAELEQLEADERELHRVLDKRLGGGVLTEEEKAFLDSHNISTLNATRNTIEDRIRALEIEERGGEEGLFNGFLDAATNANTWTFGLRNLPTTGELLSIREKIERGEELTDSEKQLLAQTRAKSEVDSRLDDESTFMYRAGRMTAEMLPFMLQIGATGGFSEVAEAAYGMGARAAESFAARYGADTAAKRAAAWVIKNTGVAIGDMAAGYVSAATVGAANTLNDIFERRMGQLTEDGEGGYTFEGGKDWLTSVWQGMTSQAIEFATERFGEHLPGLSDLSKFVQDRGGMRGLSRVLSGLEGNKALKNTWDFLGKFGIQGIPAEGLEEELGIILNTALVDRNEIEGLLDGKTQYDIWGGLALSLGAMGAVGMAVNYTADGITKLSNTYKYHTLSRSVTRASNAASKALGEDWGDIRDIIDASTNDAMPATLTNILSSGNYTPAQRQAILRYAWDLQVLRGFNLATMNEAQEAAANGAPASSQDDSNTLANVSAVQQAEDQGYNAPVEDYYQMAQEYLQAEQGLNAAGLAGIAAQRDAMSDGEWAQVMNGLGEDERSALNRYFTARATIDGALANTRDQAADATRIREEAVRVATQSVLDEGGVQQAQLTRGMMGGKEVFVLARTGNAMLVIDPETLEKQTVGANQVTDIEFLNPDEYVAGIRQEAQGAAEAGADWALSHHPKTQMPQVGLVIKERNADGTEQAWIIVGQSEDGAGWNILPAKMDAGGQYVAQEVETPMLMDEAGVLAAQDSYYNGEVAPSGEEGGGQPSGNPSGTAAATGEGGGSDGGAASGVGRADGSEVPLSDETNEFGRRFVLSSNGDTTFGEIGSDSGLPAAPLKLNEGEDSVDERGEHHGYGLAHIEAEHGDQIRAAGFPSVRDFVETVARNYQTIREGNVIAGNQTYLLELTDEHNNTLFVQLSRDGNYWNINSAGIFRTRYSRNKPEVYSRPALGSSTSADATGVNRGQTEGATATSGDSPSTSGDKFSNNRGITQENRGNINKLYDNFANDDFTGATAEEAAGWIFNEELSGLNSEEAEAVVAAKLAEATKARDKHLGKKPNPGSSIAKFKQQKAEWEQKRQEVEAAANFWNEVKALRDRATGMDNLNEEEEYNEEARALIDRAQELQDGEAIRRLGEREPETLDELIASLLSRKTGGVKLQRNDEEVDGTVYQGIKSQTGWSDRDLQRFNFLLASRGNGGITIDAFADLVREYAAHHNIPFEDETGKEVVNAILDFLQSVDGEKAISNYIQNRRIAEVRDMLRRDEEAKAEWEEEQRKRGASNDAGQGILTAESDMPFAPPSEGEIESAEQGAAEEAAARDAARKEGEEMRGEGASDAGDMQGNGTEINKDSRNDGEIRGEERPSGKPSGTAATTGEGESAEGARAEREPAGSEPAGKKGGMLVSDERMEELKKKLRGKLGQMNLGVDPELLALGAEFAVGKIERGARKFVEYAREMIADLGDVVRPYLKAFYNAVRDMPEAAEYAAEMTPYQEVNQIDVANFDKAAPDVLDMVNMQGDEEKVEQAMREMPGIKTEKRDEYHGGQSVVKEGDESGKIYMVEYVTTEGDVVPGAQNTYVTYYHLAGEPYKKYTADQLRGVIWPQSGEKGAESSTEGGKDVKKTEKKGAKGTKKGDGGVSLQGDLFAQAEEEQPSGEPSGTTASTGGEESAKGARAGREVAGGAVTRAAQELKERLTKEERAQLGYVNQVATMLVSAVNGAETERPFKGIKDLRAAAKEEGMQVDDSGRTDILLQELAELALVKAARMIVRNYNGRTGRETFAAIQRLYELQPTIGQRSSERVRLQQYSTPLPMSFVADMFAYTDDAESVLEPTAGNGMLVFAIPAKKVHANELDATRRKQLEGQGFAEVTDRDATQPFPGGRRYDAVVMNPPFGSSEAKEYDGVMIEGLDPQIVINSLESMKDDGRAAIIIGGNMEYKPNGAVSGKRDFFCWLYDHYNVVGVVDMDGEMYARQGTKYPTRMILINGRRSEEERAQSTVYPPVRDNAQGKVTTFDELYDKVLGLKNSNKKTDGNEILRSAGAPLVDSDTASGSSDGIRPSGSNRQDATDERGRNRRGGSVRDDGRDAERGTEQVDGGSVLGTVPAGNARLPESEGDIRGNASASAGRPGRSDGVSGRDELGGPGTLGTSNLGNGLERANTRSTQPQEGQPREEKKRELGEEKLPYRPHNSAFSLESVAPAAMVEAMDATLKKIEKEEGNIDEFVTRELGYGSVDEMHNALAAEQVDSVAMAIYQMKQGQALIIGDQTGVGKGRQMAALIRWAVRQGKKPIFVTRDAGLFTDIYRDLVDIGSGDLRPFIFNSDGKMLDSNDKVVYRPLSAEAQARVMRSGVLPPEYDFVVLSYSQVNTGDDISRKEMEDAAKASGKRSTKKKKDAGVNDNPLKATFLRAIAEDNYLFLDESHTAAGASNQGAYLQSILKKAKAATFASATFAKRPDTMPLYALRTAMSKANVEAHKLIEIIQKGGVTLQEIMSRALTAAGQMVRRERDMSDVRTDWKTVDDPATVARTRRNYDRTIEAFNAIIEFQNKWVKPFIESTSGELAKQAGSAGVKKGTDKMGIDNVPFASKTYNYTKQLMLALKVDAIVDEVVKEIEAGRHPVIALESTMESSYKDFGVGSILDEPTFAMSLQRGLDSVMSYTIDKGKDNKVSVPIRPSELGEAGEQAYYALRDKIRELTSEVFISPLDLIITKLADRGYKVGELTGRQTYIEAQDDGTAIVRKKKAVTPEEKKKVQSAFNSGALDVLILNKSASTGISLHASEKFSDQRQRSMIIAQPLSDINDYMQMIGRIDRTGQVHRGYYINLGLPVPAEGRFLMMLSTKLKSLNANTTTSQDSETNDVDAPDLLNKYGSQVVVEYLRDNPEVYEMMGEPLKKGNEKVTSDKLDDYAPSPDDSDVRKITGYVALLPTEMQQAFYDDVVRRYADLIQYLNETNSNDLKITVMPLRAETIEKKVGSRGTDPNGENPFARDSYVEKVTMDVLRKPMKAEEIQKQIDNLNKDTGNDKRKLEFRTASAERAFNSTPGIEEIWATVYAETEEKLAKENDRYEEAKERSRKRIAEHSDKVRANEKMTNDEKEADIEEFAAKVREDVETRHRVNEGKIRQQRTDMLNHLRRFNVGETYLVPDMMEDATFAFTSPAIFCGFKSKESGVTPSTTFAVFATLDGRRKVEIKLSDPGVLSRIKDHTMENIDTARRTTLENWDSEIPQNRRKTGYILTGNILQAINDSDGGAEVPRGKLISYTDIDGDVHDGVLMPDKWQPSMLRSAGVPINARYADIRDGKVLKSVDDEVVVGRDKGKYGVWFTLTVPKSKKKGGKYYQSAELLRLVDNGFFYERNGTFHADVHVDNLKDVLDVLSRLGVRVKEKKEEEPSGNPSGTAASTGEGESGVRFRGAEGDEVRFRLREEEAPKKTGVGYKVFVLKDGKLYPPMVANPGGAETPVGVWLDADAAPVAGQSKTGRPQVKAGGKGTQGGSGQLAYRPGWHLGEIPYALQFNRKNSETGERELFPANFVWAEVEYADDVDYQQEAEAEGMTENGKFSHALAGLKKVPVNGSYHYRTNPDPRTDPWVITGAMKVRRIMTPSEVDALVRDAGREPQKRQEGAVTDEQIEALNASLGLPSGQRGRQGEGAQEMDKALSDVTGRSRAQRRVYQARARRNARIQGERLAQRLGLPVVFVDTADDLTEEHLAGLSAGERRNAQKARGWFRLRDGRIVVVIGNHTSAEDVLLTLLHEGVAHYGLRELFGKDFDTFLANVRMNAAPEIRREIARLAERNGWDMDTATEEYLASLAEDTNFEEAMGSGWWQRIKFYFLEMLRKVGLNLGESLTDADLRYILYRSYNNLALQQEGLSWRVRDAFQEAEDVSTQRRLGVRGYENWEGERTMAAEEEGAAERANTRDTQRDGGGTAAGRRNGWPKFSGDPLVQKNMEDGFTALSRLAAGEEIVENAMTREELEPLGGTSGITFLWGKPGRTTPSGRYKGGEGISKILEKHGVGDVLRIVETIAKGSVGNPYGEDGGQRVDITFKGHQTTVSLFRFGKSGSWVLTAYTIDENTDAKGRGSDLSSATQTSPIRTREGLGAVLEVLSDEEFKTGMDTGSLPGDVAKVLRNVISAKDSDEDLTGINKSGARFRGGDEAPVMRDPVLASAMYDQRIRSSAYQIQEAAQDSMLGLKTLMDVVLKAEGRGKVRTEDVAGYENAYLMENALSSRNKAEQDAYQRVYLQPLFDEAAALAPTPSEYRDLQDYLMAKHGLERNRVMNEREGNSWDDDSWRDYAGLTGLTATTDLSNDTRSIAEVTADAEALVASYEASHNTDKIWDLIRKATSRSLEKLYDSGLLSEESYNEIRDMYEYYVPLRGWDEDTAGDVYEYLDSFGPSTGNPLKSAKGRKSKADDPFAYITSMGNSSVSFGNRNLMKQAFLRFAENHPSDLVSIHSLWVMYDEVKKAWIPQFPDIDENDDAATVARKVREHEARMKELHEQEPGKYKRKSEKDSIPFKVTSKDMKKSHQVVVSRGGQVYVLTINGSPRAAQALNGYTNPDHSGDGAINVVMRGAEHVNRFLSDIYTSKSPDFVIRNFMRDRIYTRTISFAKEGAEYGAKFNKNLLIANPALMLNLMRMYESGTLDMRNALHRQFLDFMMNGGETGYGNLDDMSETKAKIQKELARRSKGKLSATALAAQAEQASRWYNMINRAIENAPRFAAFLTSREIGRSVTRSIWDAKDISVNFNKKGAGDRFLGGTGQTAAGNLAAFLSGAGRAMYVFWNPAVQGVTNFCRVAKYNPKAGVAAAAVLFGLGLAVATMCYAVGGDDDDYLNVPDYIRRNNIVLPLSKGLWLTLALPQEYRGLYGAGELTYNLLSGKEKMSWKEASAKILSLASSSLPLNLMEGISVNSDESMISQVISNLIPTLLKPAWDVYSRNRTWYGIPVTKKAGQYDKRVDPEYNYVKSSTSGTLIDMAKFLNWYSGGDDAKAGVININPDRAQYLLQQYLGGPASFLIRSTNVIERMAGAQEKPWNEYPLVRTLFTEGGEEAEARAIVGEFFKMKDESEKVLKTYKNYVKNANQPREDAEYYREKRDEVGASDEYVRGVYFDELNKDYRKIREAINEAKKNLVDSLQAAGEQELADHEAWVVTRMRETPVDSMRAELNIPKVQQ